MLEKGNRLNCVKAWFTLKNNYDLKSILLNSSIHIRRLPTLHKAVIKYLAALPSSVPTCEGEKSASFGRQYSVDQNHAVHNLCQTSSPDHPALCQLNLCHQPYFIYLLS